MVESAEPGFSELVFSDLLRYRPHERPRWLGVIARCLVLPGLIASVILRAQQCLFRAGHVRAANMLRTVGVILVGADFVPGVEVGRGLYLPHPVGVVIGAKAVIGDQVLIAQGVTIGARIADAALDQPYPRIGEGATLFSHAVVVGDVRIGRYARVGANSLVTSDVADYAIVAGVPARQVGEVERD